MENPTMTFLIVKRNDTEHVIGRVAARYIGYDQ